MADSVASIYDPGALLGGRGIRVEAYYIKLWQGYDMAPHTHSQMEIMAVTQGRCTVGVGEQRFTLRKNELILLDAGVPHSLTVTPDAPCRIVNLEFTVNQPDSPLPLADAARRAPHLARWLSRRQDVCLYEDTEDVHGILRRTLHCLDDGEGDLTLALLTAELLLALARLARDGAPGHGAGQIHVRWALRFMHQNYDRDISLSDIAAQAAVAPATLSRAFRRVCGQSVLGYLTALRIRRAQMLLQKTDLPIVDISAYVGVPNRPYFNQLFKKHTGMTPGQCRRAFAREENMYPGCR